jgi:hypothetical protein
MSRSEGSSRHSMLLPWNVDGFFVARVWNVPHAMCLSPTDRSIRMEDLATLSIRCSCKPGWVQISMSSVSVEYKSGRVHRLYPIASPNSDSSLQCSKYLRVRSIKSGYRCAILTHTLHSSPVWPLCSDDCELFSWCSAWTVYVLPSQLHCSQGIHLYI